eukprot:s531_g17.t1
MVSSGALCKQRLSLLEICANKRVLKVEAAILSAVEFPSVLSSCSIQVTPDMMFQATFNDDSEKIVKKFPSILKANDWLVSLTIAYKKGSLHKHLDQTHRDVRSSSALQVASDRCMHKTENICDTIAGSPSLRNLRDELQRGDSDHIDMTSDMLRPSQVYTCSLLSSTNCIHRGSFNSFVKLGASTPDLKGVLLGTQGWNKKFHVMQIVLTTGPLAQLISQSSVVNKCQACGWEAGGFIVVGQRQDWRDQVPVLMELVTCEYPLFVGVDYSHSYSGTPYLLELCTDKNPFMIRSVQPSWTTQPKDGSRKISYNICWEHDLNQSAVLSATDKVCNAVVDYVHRELENAGKKKEPIVEQQSFQRVVIPADGYCGWHSLIASQDLKAYRKIPRKAESGYAQATLLVQREERAAKQLCQSTCEKAFACLSEHWHPHIRRVMEQGVFAPSDLEWISAATGTYIRCIFLLFSRQFALAENQRDSAEHHG